MGTVFQSPSLDRALTVRQNLYYHGALHGLGPGATLVAGREMLDRLGVGELLDHRVATLSGGQARRVEIARALLHRPALLLCDEATVGLDVKARQDIVAYLHDETAAGRLGVLWATHSTEEVALDDPVVILHQGRVKARGLARPCANRRKAR
jgi:ABC-2 type transport system ATP-binding protein